MSVPQPQSQTCQPVVQFRPSVLARTSSSTTAFWGQLTTLLSKYFAVLQILSCHIRINLHASLWPWPIATQYRILFISNIEHRNGRSIVKWCATPRPVSSVSLQFNPLNAELNPICYLLALLGTHHFLHISSIRVKSLTLRLLMSYIYIYIWSTNSWCF